MGKSSFGVARETRQRAVQVLSDYPESTLSTNARRIGISRMHLYRLAVQFPDVRKAYKWTLELRHMEADDYAIDALFGSPRPYKQVYAAMQQAMRYEYYLSRWKRREQKVRVVCVTISKQAPV